MSENVVIRQFLSSIEPVAINERASSRDMRRACLMRR
jgi:hypothetical protein